MAVQNGLSIQKNNGEEDFFDSLKKKGLQDDEPYIHLHSKNLQLKKFEDDYAKIDDQFDEKVMLNLLKVYTDRNIQKATASINRSETKALFATLGDSNKNAEEIDALLKTVATQLNEKVEEVERKNLEAYQYILQEARTAAYNAFENAKPENFDVQSLEDFLGLLNSAVIAVDKTLENNAEWETFLVDYYDKVLGNKMVNGTYLNFSPEGQKKFGKVATYLDTMANKFLISNGEYSKSSIGGSLSNIFYKALGEVGLGNSSKKVVKKSLTKINDNIKRLKSVEITPTGADVRPGQSVSQKTDYIIKLPDGSAIRVRVKEGADTIDITGELSVSAKWVAGFKLPKDGGDTTNIKANISLETTGSAYKQMLDDKLSPYVAANSLAFQDSKFVEKYIQQYKRYLLKTNLVNYLAGRANESGGTVLLMCINGYYYPVYSLLYAYLKWALDNKTSYQKHGLIYINIQGKKDNTYVDDQKADDLTDALARSRAVFEQIKEFIFEVKLRGSELGRLLQATLTTSNIQPII